MKHQEPCYFLLHKQFGCIKYLHFPTEFWPLYKHEAKRYFFSMNFLLEAKGKLKESQAWSWLLEAGSWLLGSLLSTMR